MEASVLWKSRARLAGEFGRNSTLD